MATHRLQNEFGGDIGEQRFSEMFDRYKQHIAWIGIALLVLGAGTWFYARSKALREEHSQQAYQSAIQSAAAGNVPLAESDLRKASVRYKGTNGGAEAAMALAKLYYQDGKYQDGVAALSGTVNEKGDLQYDARVLRGAGYEGMSQWQQAATSYESAANVARFDADRDAARAMAARAFQLGGNKMAAVKIWTDLLNDPRGAYVAEAKVRLGELQAGPMKV